MSSNAQEFRRRATMSNRGSVRAGGDRDNSQDNIPRVRIDPAESGMLFQQDASSDNNSLVFGLRESMGSHYMRIPKFVLPLSNSQLDSEED